MKKLAIVSLGCAKNLVDSEIMLGQLVSAGWELTSVFNEAELILVNTCGFIEAAKQESIENILEMAEYKKAGIGKCRKLVVAGCLVQRYAAELANDLPEVDYWIGLGELGDVVAKISREITGLLPEVKDPFLNEPNLHRYQVTLRHTAYVKIAEGCDHCCSYCAIPLIKGRFRSRSQNSIIREIRGLVQSGVKEINLIAQDVTMYGSDLVPRSSLVQLLRSIIDQAQPEWIRLLYAYPSGISPQLLELMAREPSICKYLDLPLQHIQPRILQLMNRPDSPAQLREQLALIRTILPDAVLRTTFIVGFPTETEQEFAELLAFVREGYFAHVGAFAYSREEQTAAYNLENQIEAAVRQERRQRLLQAQQPVTERFLASMVNQQQAVLIDRVLGEGQAVGRSAALAPDIDGVIYVADYKGEAGQIVLCRINGFEGYDLHANVIP